ncbi:hypothetical protein MKK67_12825, partial [Methylobacterium sp. J-072]|uniref:hypothetical protein n=1 Tax=Methylobacterium sp. J-072 TaxID=2836651 RepID=UPI001FBBAB99
QEMRRARFADPTLPSHAPYHDRDDDQPPVWSGFRLIASKPFRHCERSEATQRGARSPTVARPWIASLRSQ